MLPLYWIKMFKGSLNSTKLYLGLTKQAEISRKKLHKRQPHVVKFFTERGITPGNIRRHAAKVAATAAVAGSMLFAQPLTRQVLSTPANQIATMTADQLRTTLVNQLANILPPKVQPLTPEEEQAISREINAVWGIDARGTLAGEHLNTTYGVIGAEQHIPRYPGDTINQHDAYQQAGITPGLGGWGYFAPSKNQMTQDLYAKETWYVAVQTLYLPDWRERLPYLIQWYKYRKVLVVNVKNGKTVVADVADAGPADWTGKHFGGSPEVMAYLGLNVGMQKGAVLLFFVNDPGNEIPLGPVEYNIKAGT